MMTKNKKMFIISLFLIIAIIGVSYQNVSAKEMPQIIDMVTNGEKCAALCADGSVWGWAADKDINTARRVFGLKGIKKLLCAGPAMYALSEEGEVYVWGSNRMWQISADELYQENAEEAEARYYNKPVRIKGLSEIVDLDVCPDVWKGRLFAVDRNQKFYVSGVYFFWNDEENFVPDFPEGYRELVEGVSRVFAGRGSYHYFIRENGTTFSIMDYSRFDRSIGGWEVNDFIFPQFPVEEHTTGEETLRLRDISYVQIAYGSKMAYPILYELGTEEGINCIDSDCYTMFVSRKDGTLWYWDSGMVRLHDSKRMISEANDNIPNYTGRFQQVDLGKVLGIREGNEMPQVIDIRAGKENFLFLTDDGQVFVSDYIDCERIEDSRYFYDRLEWPDLKTLGFQKLDWENIISINTDNDFQFTAVDDKGRYYHLDKSPETDE